MFQFKLFGCMLLARLCTTTAVLEANAGDLPVSDSAPYCFVYINDIVNVVSTPVQICLFADDCVLFREVTCLSDQREQWGMLLNASKCVCLPITRKKA